MLNRHLVISALAATSAFALAPSSFALADVANPDSVASANWAGYAVSGQQPFSSVSGRWVEPNVDCSVNQGDSSFWIGLGGQGGGRSGLEQTGTSADCTSGQAVHYAWYELIPAGPVRLPVAISPGDHVAARVQVNGTTVHIELRDQTSGQSASRTLRTDSIDVSSAEWIAEAPSQCDGDDCQPVSLADFGSASFTHASATAGGHRGTISDPQWSASPMTLTGQELSASPSTLSRSGDAFSVAVDDGSSAGGDPSVDPSAGYGSGYSDPGYGDGSGYSDPGYGSGYGYGYGDGSGYGYDPGYSDPGYGSGYGYGDDGGWSFSG
jgi:peptidase A4-like protein